MGQYSQGSLFQFIIHQLGDFAFSCLELLRIGLDDLKDSEIN